MANSPQYVGAYELVRPLGQGGMAETFVAVRKGPASFAQQVCLKRILPSNVADPTFVELFLDEARLLARLQSGNIVHVYDFGEADGTYYLAMELVDGYDLAKLLSILRNHRRSMPLPVALYVLSEILTALSYAHGLVVDGEPMGIVHRDISPSNILLSKTGEVKLTDFGIAKARGRSHRTQTGQIKGKIGYMSPEQIRGQAIDARSDLFSLGVVLFELLTGVHPFEGTTDFAVQLLIVSGKRAQLRELRPDIHESVVHLVDALLATEANARVASAAAALAMVPNMGSPYVLSQQLAELMLSPATSSAPGHIATAPIAYPAPIAAPERLPASAPAKSALGSFAPVPEQAHGGPSAVVNARESSSPAWLLLPLAMLGIAAAGYGLWLRQRAHPNDAIQQEAGAHAVGGGPPLLPELPKGPVEDVITPTNRAQPPASTVKVEHVITPPKGVEAPGMEPPRNAQRTKELQKLLPAAPSRPVREAVSPPKSDQPAPAPQPVERVISPNDVPNARGGVSLEDAISPSKTR
jgi:eukaryotic-like serine/threonine-protein kinase